MGHLSQAKITFIYFFSQVRGIEGFPVAYANRMQQVVVPKPLDWPDTVSLSG